MYAEYYSSATAEARRIREGNLTSSQLLSVCLERVHSREAEVHAWSYVAESGARAEAERRDNEKPNGILHGLPIGVKDIFDTADMPTEYGSSIYSGHRPRRDAASVAILRAAGAVVLGKTVTTEFALHTAGKTTNPWDPDRTPGGSSSGSAAAVAAGMVQLAVGTQTGGSLIRPAAFCGVVGYKPSYGIINRTGVMSVSESLDTVGVFANSVADAALLAAVLSGRPAWRADPRPSAPRLGLCRTPFWHQAEQESRDAVQSATELLRGHGASVAEVVLPSFYADLDDAVNTIVRFEAARALAHEHRVYAHRLGDELRDFLEEGQVCPPAIYDEAQELARRARRALPRLFAGLDVLITPSSAGEAPRGLVQTGDPVFNSIWTVLHAPCLHLPSTTGPHGMPVGIQLIGRPGNDTQFIGAAQWVEAHLDAQR